MKRKLIICLYLMLLVNVTAQNSTILTETFENSTFPTSFVKSGNDSWNPGSPSTSDYQGTFWDNLYCSSSSTQTSEISTAEFHSGSQSLKLTLTNAAQLLSPKLRSTEFSLTGNSQTISDWKNFKVSMWIKVLKTDGTTFGTDKAIFVDQTSYANDTWKQFVFNSTATKYSTGLTATKIVIAFANLAEDYVVYIDDVTVEKTDNTWIGGSSIQWNLGANWSDGVEPTSTRNAYVPVTVNKPQVSTTGAPQLCNNLYIETGAILNFPTGTTELKISAGGELTNNGTINLNTGGPLTLLSDASGTATLINNSTIQGNGTVSFQRYLASARNWYISSPIAAAKVPASNTFYSYLEDGSNIGYSSPANEYWKSEIAGNSMEVGRGYIAQPNGETTYTFTGSLNNNSLYEIPVTRTVAAIKPGFNLVGNPYSAYLDWGAVIADPLNSNINTTFWYRTKNTTNDYTFTTHNGTSGITTSGDANTTITKYIPPTQAFWIRVNEGVSSTNLTLKKTMLSHRDVSGNIFKVPQIIIQSVLRLEVSNGINRDELVLYFNDNASNGYDVYDSQKMFNSNPAIPEIYTVVGDEQLVINGMQSIPYDLEIPVWFKNGQSNDFMLKLSEYNAFPTETQLYLIDKLTNTETLITGNDTYEFYADQSSAIHRFSLIFKSTSFTTNTEDGKKPTIVCNADKSQHIQILFISSESELKHIRISDLQGQTLLEETIKTDSYVTNRPFTKGLYLVTVESNHQLYNQKIIVR